MNKKKKKSIQSKNILIIMTVLCIGMIIFGLSKYSKVEVLQAGAGYLVSPFQKGMSTLTSLFHGNGLSYEEAQELVEKNKELESKIDTLTEQNNQLLQSQDKLSRLEELYALDQEYTEYDKIGADVISKDPGNWYSTFTIDKGTKDGIQVDMNVISGGGLVGIITETGKDWATVRSIIDDSSNVSAMAATSLDTCLVTGDLTLIEDGKLKFVQMTDKDDVVSVGDKIVTSNISDKFLKGILVGYISEISSDSNNLTKSGYLVPVVDFEHLQEVLVIKTLKNQGKDDQEDDGKDD